MDTSTKIVKRADKEISPDIENVLICSYHSAKTKSVARTKYLRLVSTIFPAFAFFVPVVVEFDVVLDCPDVLTVLLPVDVDPSPIASVAFATLGSSE